MTTNNAINNIYKDGRLADIKYYTSSTTWTKPSNMLDDDFIIIELVGGGGGSASTVSTGASSSSVSGSGAGGGYSYKKIFGSALASSETVTIGAGGAGATSTSGGAGGYGTITSFGSHASASGGSGGGAGVAAFTPSGSAQIPPAIAGIGIGGDINITGARPNRSLVFYNEGIVRIPDIRSGGSALSTSISSRGSSAGGRFPGGGACGAAHGPSATSRPGAAGASGLITIWEYY